MSNKDLIRNLKNILMSNSDGHLDLHEWLVIRETIAILESLEYKNDLSNLPS